MKIRIWHLVFCCTLLYSFSTAQEAPRKGTVVPGNILANFPHANNPQLTVIDFFGTWCAPCIKALPHLQELKQKFNDSITIVLVSIEEENVINNFKKKNPQISLPIFIDKGEQISNFFLPPSYPYSIVVDKYGSILSLTNAADLKTDSISQWLYQLNKTIEPALETKQVIELLTTNTQKKITVQTNNTLVALSQQFLYAAKTNENTDSFTKKIAAIPFDSLQLLTNDDQKKAFWINLYNGFIQLELKKDVTAYANRHLFFTTRRLKIAHTDFSYDDIEHGILRKSSIKWSLGYAKKWFPSTKEKLLRVNKVDYRIHFALNCGAKSCPPIAFYDDAKLDAQLDIATKAYLTGSVTYDSNANKVYVPALLSWFRGDFGGKKGQRMILRNQQIIPVDATPTIKYKKYDWALDLYNFNH